MSAPSHPSRLSYRPRLIWTGVATMVAGLLLGVVALVEHSWWWALAAAVVFAAGAAAAGIGRIFRDTHGTFDLGAEIAGLRDPEQAAVIGYSPATMGHSIANRHRAVHPEPGRLTDRDWAHAWGFGLLLLGCWLLVDPYLLSYPTEIRSGVDGRWRDIASGVVLLLIGLWAARGERPSRVLVAAAVVPVLVLIGITETTTVPTTAMHVNEIVCGLLTILFAALHTMYMYRWQNSTRHRPGQHPNFKPH